MISKKGLKMNKKNTYILIFSIFLVFFAWTLQDFLFKTKAQRLFLSGIYNVQTSFYDKSMNNQNWSYWRDRYITQIHTIDDAYVAIDSALESLDDPYTRFLRPEEFKEQSMNINAKLHGIGVNIAQLGSNATIVGVLDDTPAQKAGLKVGDIILKVDDKDVKGLKLNEVANLVRGEVDSKVILKISRDNKTIVYNIKRSEIKIKTVKLKKDGDIAHIVISSFLSQNTPDEVKEALSKSKNAKGIILDLRGNTGGLLPNAIEIANMFLPEGNIVSVVDRNGKKINLEGKKNNNYIKTPLVILINEGSASASEILSGALKDYDRAILVGEKTFGKGLVQRIETIQEENGLNITIAKYLTPNGTDINKKGIEPDYKVEFSQKDFLNHKDPQLKKAKQILRNYDKIKQGEK